MYDGILGHRAMLADGVRMAAYRNAIHEVVKKGDVVADIGTGSGILAFFAVQAGAGRVYAIEQYNVIEGAKALSGRNGFDEKIVFIKGRSDKIELPEKADVITSEIIGNFGMEENITRFKIDARDRFLKQGGKLLPEWIELYIAPVESEKIWKRHVEIWSDDLYGLDFSTVKKRAASETYVLDCTDSVVPLAEPSKLTRIDFYMPGGAPFILQCETKVRSKGVFHGILGWFKAGLSSTVTLSTSAEEPTTHWKQKFFPMEEKTIVEQGDAIRFKLKSISSMGAAFWQWDTSIHRGRDKIAGFSQCNLNLTKKELIVGREDFKPRLTRKGFVHGKVLALCDEKRTMREISTLIFRENPDKYRSIKDAMRDVANIIRPLVSV